MIALEERFMEMMIQHYYGHGIFSYWHIEDISGQIELIATDIPQLITS